MNAIIEVQNGASRFIRLGWKRVLESIGINTILWDVENVPAHDIFNSFPVVDIFLGTSYNLNRATIKCINNRPNMSVALFTSAWGKLVDNIDRKKYPIDYVSEQEKINVLQIKKRISCLFIHCGDKYLNGVLGGWTENLGIPILSIENGADLFQYYNAKPEEKYKCDISFVGGRWDYKAKTLDKYLGKLCQEKWESLNIKIFGNGWQCPQSLGVINQGEDAKVFASSTICPNISELHSEDLKYDLIERIYKVPCAGGFLICDNVDLSETNLTDCVPQFSSYEEFLHLIQYYLDENHENERKSLLKRQHSVVTLRHTYFERIFKLLKFLNFEDELKVVLQKKKELFGLDSIYNED